jgi:uncharacterized protein with FMN-binding domain
MKKFLLSFGLIFVFTAYVLYQRQSGSSTIVVNTQNNPPPATAPNPTPQNNPVSNFFGSFSGNEGGGEGVIPKKTTTTTTTKPKTTTPTPTPTPVALGQYKNGTYTGSAEDAYYGTVQVQAVIQSGKLANVNILQYPSDRGTSIRINTYAMPILVSEAIQAQSANIDGVSGASESSPAFARSLATALANAAN